MVKDLTVEDLAVEDLTVEDRKSRSAQVPRAELRLALEVPYLYPTHAKRPDGRPPLRLGRARVSQLLNRLDPGHTGLVHRARLETLVPGGAGPSSTDGPVLEAPEDPEHGRVLCVPLHRGEEETGEVVSPAGGGEQTDRTSRTSQTPLRLQDKQPRSVLADLRLDDPECNGAPPRYPGPVSHTQLDEGSLQSPSGPAGGPGAPGLLGVVFRRLREGLEPRGATLDQRIQATTRLRPDGALRERDLRKVLEDSWVILEDEHFDHITRLLGFKDGRLDRSEFLDKQQQGEGNCGDGQNKPHFLSTEEERGTLNVLDQIQDQLTSDLRYKRQFMLQALCGTEEDEGETVLKSSLKNFLFTSDLPLRPEEFERLWISQPPGPVYQVESLRGLGLDQALSRLQELVKASAPVLKKAFSTFDPRGSGQVEVGAFRRVLESVCGSLSDPQFRHALGGLAVNWETGTVDWEVFLDRSVPEALRCHRPSMHLSSGAQRHPSMHLFSGTQRHPSMHLFSGTQRHPSMHLSSGAQRHPSMHLSIGAQRHPSMHLSSSTQRHPSMHLSSRTQRHPSMHLSSGAQRHPSMHLFSSTQRHPSMHLFSSTQRHPSMHLSSGTQRHPSMHLFSRSQREGSDKPSKFDITANEPASHPDFVLQFLRDLRPLEVNRAFQRNRLPAPNSTTGGPGVLSAQCVDVLLRLHHAVRSSWRSIRQAFVTYDPDRTGRVTMQDFRKVLLCFRLSLTEEELFHLGSFFDPSALGTISYNDFLRAYVH
ncbi:hypothetical protein NHX12_020389 [Muraenolepis orangiensis]|uniref:EF-hand domain-containing protein n=1 Tax=Muraenolepis orangiensis TaxID=630683 RepID=A0A9Q0ERC0_9TELE|nr:hypothetical protein NHX12_020389 [Muraenolepis orangiensis]